jgi:hypothetical protein
MTQFHILYKKPQDGSALHHWSTKESFDAATSSADDCQRQYPNAKVVVLRGDRLIYDPPRNPLGHLRTAPIPPGGAIWSE